ncbi:pseudouridine synthase [Candidatus Peregrinibacteria bacterium]|nr:pseudouridine synthase [Candidatus Peregrinibacteria bacterium]
MRINKFISSNSKYSRRKADELIKSGSISINGRVVKKLGTKINPEKDIVKIGNKKIKSNSDKVYFALNKPKNYITTRKDELDRKTVMSLLPKIKNLKPVGRLDKDTEGLLLLTNDGEFINRHTHPAFKCQKEYFAKIKGELKSEEKDKLEKGILLENKKTTPAKIKILKIGEKETDLKITMSEGRKRQIRKMFAYFDHPVKYLKRIKIGKIHLGPLKKGSYRKLSNSEINAY